MSLCEKYPDIPVIFGHLGGTNRMDVIRFAKGHNNVYLDLSAAFSSLATKIALTELPERCLYSSDAPYGEPELYQKAQGYMEQILQKNPQVDFTRLCNYARQSQI